MSNVTSTREPLPDFYSETSGGSVLIKTYITTDTSCFRKRGENNKATDREADKSERLLVCVKDSSV